MQHAHVGQLLNIPPPTAIAAITFISMPVQEFVALAQASRLLHFNSSALHAQVPSPLVISGVWTAKP
jgi:hypothetical protein